MTSLINLTFQIEFLKEKLNNIYCKVSMVKISFNTFYLLKSDNLFYLPHIYNRIIMHDPNLSFIILHFI